MNLTAELRNRFARALHAAYAELTPAEIAAQLDSIRRAQDARFGDFQANCAMPLSKRLGQPARAIAEALVAQLDVENLCQPPEIAGPGFINLRVRDDQIAELLQGLVADARLGAPAAGAPRTIVIDYSGPNVAKPMHVGHIRSTVIGDALYRVLKFLGHQVIGDNHLGDWGTQFGMILYGYKHLRDEAALAADPIQELSRLYRTVQRLIDYRETRGALTGLEQAFAELTTQLAALEAQPPPADKAAAKKLQEERKRQGQQLADAKDQLQAAREKIARLEADPAFVQLRDAHPQIEQSVLQETAKLHAGDQENLELWRKFMPACRASIDAIYDRLGVKFDETLGESFYHDRLPGVVEELRRLGLSQESDGAVCVFLEGAPAPFIVQKRDGAYLYATTDLATIQYRMERWQPDEILYVVDHRQSLHFEQLFAVARLWGVTQPKFAHVGFGTVLGSDGRPYKTRSGDTVGLMGLLDEAVQRALEIVSANDDKKPDGPELDATARRSIAEAVGLGALKYADLSQNRTSDYTFSYDKMLAMTGNTGTYLQYAYARVRSIFRKGAVDAAQLRVSGAHVQIEQPAERALALEILQFPEALNLVVADYRPNQLTAYLYSLASVFATFFEQCPVLKADTPQQRTSRLLLCDLTARVMQQGLDLLGIRAVEQM